MQHVNQAHNVRMLQLFKKGDLTNGRTRDAFVLALKPDLFKCVDLTGVYIPCFINDTISALSDALELFVFVNASLHKSTCSIKLI